MSLYQKCWKHANKKATTFLNNFIQVFMNNQFKALKKFKLPNLYAFDTEGKVSWKPLQSSYALNTPTLLTPLVNVLVYANLI